MKEHRDAMYLFACHLEWHNKRNITAYNELAAALHDPDADIRDIAESLLRRNSSRTEDQSEQSAPETVAARTGQVAPG